MSYLDLALQMEIATSIVILVLVPEKSKVNFHLVSSILLNSVFFVLYSTGVRQ